MRGVKLDRQNLREMDLHDLDFTMSDMVEADLTGADLRDAKLAGVDLFGANLHGADLRGANLEGANLNNAILTDAQNRRRQVRRRHHAKRAPGGVTSKYKPAEREVFMGGKRKDRHGASDHAAGNGILSRRALLEGALIAGAAGAGMVEAAAEPLAVPRWSTEPGAAFVPYGQPSHFESKVVRVGTPPDPATARHRRRAHAASAARRHDDAERAALRAQPFRRPRHRSRISIAWSSTAW